MLTKGDVLTFLGKASGPLGSYEGKEVKGEMKIAKTEGAKTETAKVCNYRSILCTDDVTDVCRWYFTP